jgi:hypothetical protein
LKIRRNYENRTSPAPSVFEKIRKIRPKRIGDDGETVKTENTDKSADFIDKSVGLVDKSNQSVFQKISVAISGQFLSKTG